MSETTNIAWCHHTASPWFGCTQVDPCCTNCYAMVMTLRRGWAGWGDKAERVRSKGFWKDVYKWNQKAFCGTCGYSEFIGSDDCRKCGKNFSEQTRVRPRVFTSLMDWLDKRVPIQWFGDYLNIIRKTPNLDHLTLTKRIDLWGERMCDILNLIAKPEDADSRGLRDWVEAWLNGDPPDNVWLGFTAGTRKSWHDRSWSICKIPAKVRWCSAEPLLEPLAFQDCLCDLDWLVVGGESGPGRREGAGVEGIEALARSAKERGVPVFVKQDFCAQPGKQGRISDEVWALKEFPVV